MNDFFNAVAIEFLVSVAASAFGFLIARTVIAQYERLRYGGWRLVVRDANGREVTSRPVGVAKAKIIFDDDADLSVFVKGVASPYGWLNVDPVTVGREIGLFYTTPDRRMVVDLRKNPPAQNGRSKA